MSGNRYFLTKMHTAGRFRRKGGMIWLFLFPLIFAVFPVCTHALPALLTGSVTFGNTGQPVIGARIEVNGQVTWSVSGGMYNLSVNPAGTFIVTCTKPGFSAYTSAPVQIQPGITTVLPIQLNEELNPPAAVTAILDTVTQWVPISWSPPSGNYELLHDDGLQEGFIIWSFQGNMNAVKFTPRGYPASVTGGNIHLGNPSNYPAGSNPLQPFQVQICLADGVNGLPGTLAGGPYTVVPLSYGWNEFVFPDTILIGSGSYYMVMVQGGNPPNAAGLAIDETSNQFVSYSRFVTGSSPWFPAGGNYMMRSRVSGPGGPAFVHDLPGAPSSYKIWRLRQGEEQNPAAWVPVGMTAGQSCTDSGWSSLPCGPYRWAVTAGYPDDNWSVYSFSNIIGKCWTSPVNISIITSCEYSGSRGALVMFRNLVYTDTLYTAISDSSGFINFPSVWKGSYKLTVARFGYDTLIQTVPVTGPVSLNLNLLQVRIPPEELTVNDSSLMARWKVPTYEKILFSENWSSGSFLTQQWSVSPSNGNWGIHASNGNPAPSAQFYSLPPLQGYDQSLASKTLSGVRSTLLILKYDIFLETIGTTTVNQMAVEIWDGTQWTAKKNYSNASGNILWTREELDISEQSWNDFRIRFRASGGSSQDIGRWNIDNVSVVASEPAQQQANCIIGYYFYLDNAIIGYTTQNAFRIPPEQVQFGSTYTACVRALYGSGDSGPACTTFTARYLWPVRNLDGYPLETDAWLYWDKPAMVTDTSSVTPPGLLGYVIYRDKIQVGENPQPDSVSYVDENLEPGFYQYTVSARYDLEPYGFPGQQALSMAEGPLQIPITWGRELPFHETWESSTFSFNDWTFFPSQSNWTIDVMEGFPVPSALFAWQPPQVDYDLSLVSPVFNGVPYTCAAIWLDFDIRLADRNSTSAEKLLVEVYHHGEWHQKAEFSNTGSFDWSHQQVDLSLVRGKGFRIRFRAVGLNSADLVSWSIDNILITTVCYPAENPMALPAGMVVNLSWEPPVCHGGNILDQGFEDPGFPPAEWSILHTNPTARWIHVPISSPVGVHSGNFSTGLNWDYTHQDEWLIAEDVYVTGDLTFWSYAYQGSLHQDHYYVKISSDNGQTWQTLFDLSAMPPYPSPNGINDWETPYTVNLSAYTGEIVDIAWHAIDGDGSGLWYPWAVDDCRLGISDHQPLQLLGYDIYRRKGSEGEFSRRNSQPVPDTVFQDPVDDSGVYYYFVQSRFEECMLSENSDTIPVDVITGHHELSFGNLRIFPNPAQKSVTILADQPVDEIQIYSLQGSLIHSRSFVAATSVLFELPPLTDGLYLLKISSESHSWNRSLLVGNH